MKDKEIDSAILEAAKNKRLKVAKIIADVEDLIAAKMAPLSRDAILMQIATQIGDLVENGDLIGYGNLKNWRHSEITLPGATEKLVQFD